MRTITGVAVMFLLFISIGGEYSANSAYGLQAPSNVQIIPMDEITPEHPMYDILNQAILRQFGVGGGVDELADYMTDWIAEYNEQRRLEWFEHRSRLRRVEAIVAAGVGIIVWIRDEMVKNKEKVR